MLIRTIAAEVFTLVALALFIGMVLAWAAII